MIFKYKLLLFIEKEEEAGEPVILISSSYDVKFALCFFPKFPEVVGLRGRDEL